MSLRSIWKAAHAPPVVAMGAEATNVEAMQVIYHCDVPRCLERFGSVHAPELWSSGVPTRGDGLPDDWALASVVDADRRTILRVVLCPEHAALAEHWPLVELVLGLMGVKAPEAEDADTPVPG